MRSRYNRTSVLVKAAVFRLGGRPALIGLHIETDDGVVLPGHVLYDGIDLPRTGGEQYKADRQKYMG